MRMVHFVFVSMLHAAAKFATPAGRAHAEAVKHVLTSSDSLPHGASARAHRDQQGILSDCKLYLDAGKLLLVGTTIREDKHGQWHNIVLAQA